MSYVYNLRRGARAHAPRPPRRCAYVLGCKNICERAGRYCDDHYPPKREES